MLLCFVYFVLILPWWTLLTFCVNNLSFHQENVHCHICLCRLVTNSLTYILTVSVRYFECHGTPRCDHSILNTLAPGWFQGFSKKKRLNARGFAQEFLRSGMLYRPGNKFKRRGKSSSLHSKKKFLLGGCGFFMSDVINGGLLGHLGPLCLALGANR